MSVLTEPFPVSLNVDGADCPVNADFRTVLKCYEIQGNKKDLSDGELLRILCLFYKKRVIFSTEHVNQMFWFFSCGREEKKKAFPRRAVGINNRQPFDFEEDAELIYAGFIQQYGIDLQEESMHWWKFMILLENLGADTRLSRIIEYRTIDTSNKKLSKEERRFYQAMQSYYGLDDRQAPEMTEQDRMIEEALLNDGNVSKLLRGDHD